MQEKIKITLSLDKRTLDLLDKYVSKHYLDSKSQAVRVLVNKDAETNKTKTWMVDVGSKK